MTSRGATRQEQRELARTLRAQGRSWSLVAAALRERCGLTARVAMRVAHDWSQAEAAAAWNARWPTDPKSFKNISYWETWPSPTGHAPSLAVLERLAQVYECSVADLVAGWGEHGPASGPAPESSPAETLDWQIENLGLPQLTRSLADRAQQLPGARRQAVLLGLSTAAALAAGRPAPLGGGPQPTELAGDWTSRYTYFSTGRDAEFEGVHSIRLRSEGGRLVGRSEPASSGCIELDLRADGLLITGTWTERTAAGGYYRGAVYHGVVQLVIDPAGRSMVGRWLGPDKDLAVNSGPWVLSRSG